MTPGEARDFYEDDEDPAKVFAAYDAGGKVITAPPADWQTSCAAQVRWGLGYIRDRYGPSGPGSPRMS